MGKFLGVLCILGGISGYLFHWQQEKRMRRERLHAFILFLQKTRYAMDNENIKIGKLLQNYQTKELVLQDTLQEIAVRLSQNLYPNGPSLWEEVFREKEQNWNMDEETFGFMIYAGNGLFGKTKGENICFLQKSIYKLEEQERKIKEMDANEKKVWIPVGMLSGMMLVILFI